MKPYLFTPIWVPRTLDVVNSLIEGAAVTFTVNEGSQSRDLVRHVGSSPKAVEDLLGDCSITKGCQIGQRLVLQRPPSC